MNEGPLPSHFTGEPEADYLRTLDYQLLVLEMEDLYEDMRTSWQRHSDRPNLFAVAR